MMNRDTFSDSDDYSPTLADRGYPNPFPNGWYMLLVSDELRRGQVRSVRRLGTEFVAFRGNDGIARVLDAYCPHLGANRGVAGRVVGNHLECPFHGWQFDGEGQCVRVPYSQQRLPRITERVWPVVERDGWILIWYHARAEAPAWQPPEVADASTEQWPRYRVDRIVLRAHVQEACENLSDLSHFAILHRGSIIPSMVDFEIDADRAASDRHERRTGFTTTVRVLGRRAYAFRTDLLQTGPGLMYQRNHFAVPSVILSAYTPIDDVRLLIVRQSFLPRRVLSLLTRRIFHEIQARQAMRDVVIWDRKVYRSKPMLLKEDGLILDCRRWFEQFYV
jgi:nitrite reductase/ring-hydroxylating ferredoxin subunit